jgi:hypothetical protein
MDTLLFDSFASFEQACSQWLTRLMGDEMTHEALHALLSHDFLPDATRTCISVFARHQVFSPSRPFIFAPTPPRALCGKSGNSHKNRIKTRCQ